MGQTCVRWWFTMDELREGIGMLHARGVNIARRFKHGDLMRNEQGGEWIRN